METQLDIISKGEAQWQDLCRDCDNTMIGLMKHVKTNKSHIKIDENHVYMVGKYGPVIKYEKDGETQFKNVIKDLDLDKLKNGEYKLEDIVVDKPKFGGRNLGTFKNNEVILKKGKFGLYMVCGGKNYSLKVIRKSENSIKLEDVLDILLGTKSTNPNVIKILDNNLSVRKGKYGPYIYYKTEQMKKPRFFNFSQILGEKRSGKQIMALLGKWPNNQLVTLINDRCL